ncbi:ATP synthase subunit I [Peptostreptococcus stomatis]|uniref:ATP synthase subunit I n=1 Tax=Peptostreptococcus stomatis TaxID=341694 RepID=UPI003F9F4C11
MDKQLMENLKKIYIGIGVYDLVGLVVIAVIGKASVSTMAGLIAGSIVAMLGLFSIAKNLDGLGDRDKTKATLSSLGGYAFRIFIYGAILVFAATTKHINVYTVAFGLISTNIVIKAQNLLGGKNLIKKIRKED